MFETRLYIQVSDKRVKVSSPQIATPFETRPFVAIEDKGGNKIISAIGREAEALQGRPNVALVNPFAHVRTVLGDFTVGEKLLQHAIRSVLKDRWLVLQLFAIIHPERQLEGGLTQVELRALRELCENAGCRRSAVHEGRPLTMEEVRSYEMRA
jgi:rod shape-determining protein MreB